MVCLFAFHGVKLLFQSLRQTSLPKIKRGASFLTVGVIWYKTEYPSALKRSFVRYFALDLNLDYISIARCTTMDRVFEECREAALKGYRQDGLRAPRRRVARPEMIPRPIVVPASSSAEPGRYSPILCKCLAASSSAAPFKFFTFDNRTIEPMKQWNATLIFRQAVAQ